MCSKKLRVCFFFKYLSLVEKIKLKYKKVLTCVKRVRVRMRKNLHLLSFEGEVGTKIFIKELRE